MYIEQKMETYRIGIILDEHILKKLRKKQAEMIKKTKKTVTLASVIREALEKS